MDDTILFLLVCNNFVYSCKQYYQFQFLIILYLFFQWNSLIRNFRSEIPLARHRRYMKTYDECFVASDAVEWLHQYLKNNPNFGTNVSRYKIQLKFSFSSNISLIINTSDIL